MKVSPAMVEAGVAALARVKKQNPVDESIVATVFSHMYGAHLTEQARMAGVDTKVPYVHKAWPAWRFGPHGNSKICHGPEEVPEGWTEHPAVYAPLSADYNATLSSAVVEAFQGVQKRRGRPPKVRDDGEHTVS